MYIIGTGLCSLFFCVLRWLEIVFEIFFTRKRFTFIYVITAFMVATRTSNNCTFPSHFIFDTLES